MTGIEKINLSQKILAIYCNDSVYIGLGSKLLNYTTQKSLVVHEKSIRCISGNSQFIGCCSYDGTASVFDKSEKFVDKIEGPDTEVKGMSFFNSFIALTTRGKTTWILENFEISKILEDHTQDIKGCSFKDGRLFTWSYDGSIKIYDLFHIDHSWELSQSIDLGEIVWNVLFYGDRIVATLHDGTIAILKKVNYLYEVEKVINCSVTPIYASCVGNGYLALVCNRNSLLILDQSMNKIKEIPDIADNSYVLSMAFYEKDNCFVCGSEKGTLSFIPLSLII